MDCGFVWAEWSATPVPDTATSCDDEGNTSSYTRQCVWVNATHETLIDSYEPVLDNCGDDRPKRAREVSVTGDGECSYISQRSVKELDGFVLTKHARFRVFWRLQFDLFLRPGQTGSVEVLKIKKDGISVCAAQLLVTMVNINETAFELKFDICNDDNVMKSIIVGPVNLLAKWFEVDITDIKSSGEIDIDIGSYFKSSTVFSPRSLPHGDDFLTHQLGTADGKLRAYRFLTTISASCLEAMNDVENLKCSKLCVTQPRFKAGLNWSDCVVQSETVGEVTRYLDTCTGTCNTNGYCSEIFVPPQDEKTSVYTQACQVATTWEAWSNCVCSTGKQLRKKTLECTHDSTTVTCASNQLRTTIENGEDRLCGDGTYNWGEWSTCSDASLIGFESVSGTSCICPNDCDNTVINKRRRVCQAKVTTPNSIRIELGNSSDSMLGKSVELYKVDKLSGVGELITTLTDTCESGWTAHVIGEKVSCVKVGSQTNDALTALANCQLLDARLPVPQTDAEIADLLEVMRRMDLTFSDMGDTSEGWKKMWLGIKYVAGEDVYKDLMTGEIVTLPPSIVDNRINNSNGENYLSLHVRDIGRVYLLKP